MNEKELDKIPQGNYDTKKIKRRIVDWLFKYAHDEEVYEIAKFYKIKTD